MQATMREVALVRNCHTTIHNKLTRRDMGSQPKRTMTEERLPFRRGLSRKDLIFERKAVGAETRR